MYCQINEISAEETEILKQEIQTLIFDKARLQIVANKVDRLERQNQLLSANIETLKSELQWVLLTLKYVVSILEEYKYRNKFEDLINRGKFILRQLKFPTTKPNISEEEQNRKLRDKVI